MTRSRLYSAALALACSACNDAPAQTAVACTTPAVVAVLPGDITEASGITSANDPSVLWAHNDSEGSPLVYALGIDGRMRAQIHMPDAPAQHDWEDIAAGPCPAGRCLYIGDVGDNLHQHSERGIIRVAEPAIDGSGTHHVERFPFTYPGGPEDAEAIFVTPDTSVYVVSKGRRGPVTVYRYPPPLRAAETVVLEQIQTLTDGLVQLPDLITGASARSDGRVVAIRSYSRVRFYSLQNHRLLTIPPDSGIDLTSLREPQGEGIALAPDGTIYLVSESGLEGRRPALARLQCTIPN